MAEPEDSANGWPPIDPSDGWALILTDLKRDLQQIDPGHVVRLGEAEVRGDPRVCRRKRPGARDSRQRAGQRS
ncbi:hypothetical protein [Mycolicibacterium nivoides]|uniref:hypothetical protein n=1 Tax=Mycolicibacterium nivoides TaxID=2487344 RepID=UPI003C2B48A7